MDSQLVDMYIITNSKFFESHHLAQLRDRLIKMDQSKWSMIQTITLKDPQTSLIISIFFGGLGIDRFMIGDTGIGIGKLLTCGGFGIWALIDIFMIQGATREKNLEKIQPFLY